jgi:hypothetical protein
MLSFQEKEQTSKTMPKVLKAVIRYRDNEYGAFEVTSVLGYVRRTFPGVIICLDDLAWKDFNWFEQMKLEQGGEGCDGAMGVAMRDGIRRGPRYRFRFQATSGEIIFGWAGRDTVGFQAEEDFSPELEHTLLKFLESLTLGETELDCYEWTRSQNPAAND